MAQERKAGESGPPSAKMRSVIPPAKKDDIEDVAWALQTAEATWSRGDHADALKWIRRAAEAASEAEADDRALELAKAAADVAFAASPRFVRRRRRPPPPSPSPLRRREPPRVTPTSRADRLAMRSPTRPRAPAPRADPREGRSEHAAAPAPGQSLLRRPRFRPPAPRLEARRTPLVAELHRRGDAHRRRARCPPAPREHDERNEEARALEKPSGRDRAHRPRHGAPAIDRGDRGVAHQTPPPTTSTTSSTRTVPRAARGLSAPPRAPHPPLAPLVMSQAVRVVVWRGGHGVHVAPAGTQVAAIGSRRSSWR